MTARLSTRVSIRWSQDPPSEPTDTLVLSVGGYYMDLRVKEADISIEWAMAGKRVVVSQDPLRIQFTHMIDSRGYTEPDEGEFTQLPNGDDLETGIMPCPEKGNAMTPYEEVWHEFSPPAVGYNAWIVQRNGLDGTSFLGRVDDAFLSFHKSRYGHFSVRREDREPETGKWHLKYLIWDKDLPSAQTATPSITDISDSAQTLWKGGDSIELFGQQYQVCASETRSDS